MKIAYTADKLHNAGLLFFEHATHVEIMPHEGGKLITVPLDENQMMDLNRANPMHAAIMSAIHKSIHKPE